MVGGRIARLETGLRDDRLELEGSAWNVELFGSHSYM